MGDHPGVEVGDVGDGVEVAAGSEDVGIFC